MNRDTSKNHRFERDSLVKCLTSVAFSDGFKQSSISKGSLYTVGEAISIKGKTYISLRDATRCLKPIENECVVVGPYFPASYFRPFRI